VAFVIFLLVCLGVYFIIYSIIYLINYLIIYLINSLFIVKKIFLGFKFIYSKEAVGWKSLDELFAGVFNSAYSCVYIAWKMHDENLLSILESACFSFLLH
jgi:hypothetical protein